MRPLNGVRVLDFTRLLPGAYATLLMADLGADVVKVEDPRGGDPARAMPPLSGGTSVYFQILNRNKRSVTIDLRSPAARELLDRLLPAFDVAVESFRPQTARRLGVDAETLRARHPRLIHASVSGFGQSGPYAERAAHDINYEALSGILSVTTAEGQPPAVPASLIGDIGAAMHGAAGILAALYHRERTGEGASIDVAIHEAALAWLLFPAASVLAGGVPEGSARLPIEGTHACYNIYETADGRYLALGALEPKFWSGFCQRVGRPDLAVRQHAEGAEQARIVAEVRALMRTRTRDEWLAHFDGLDVCLTPVNSLADALADPHLRRRGAVIFDGRRTWLPTPISVIGGGETAAMREAIRPAPALGADTDAILADAGVSETHRAALRRAGAI